MVAMRASLALAYGSVSTSKQRVEMLHSWSRGSQSGTVATDALNIPLCEMCLDISMPMMSMVLPPGRHLLKGARQRCNGIESNKLEVHCTRGFPSFHKVFKFTLLDLGPILRKLRIVERSLLGVDECHPCLVALIRMAQVLCGNT